MRRVKDVVLFCINARSEIEFIKTIKNNIKIHNQGSVAWPLENDKLARVALAKRPFYTFHPLPPTPPPPSRSPRSPHCGDASMGSRNISIITWRPDWHSAGWDVDIHRLELSHVSMRKDDFYKMGRDKWKAGQSDSLAVESHANSLKLLLTWRLARWLFDLLSQSNIDSIPPLVHLFLSIYKCTDANYPSAVGEDIKQWLCWAGNSLQICTGSGQLG